MMRLNIVLILMLCLLLVSCGGPKAIESKEVSNTPETSNKLVVGFAQIGAESEWRLANTRSIQEAAKAENIELLFTDCLQKEENQMRAIKSFIAQKVDYIAFSPIIDSGWNEVLTEAKKANIPVIIVDRKANVDENLYVAFIGSDFYEEGRKSAIKMAELLNNKGNIYEIQGTLGSDAATKRKMGFEDELKKNYPDMKIVRSEVGDFYREKGNEIMKSFLKEEAENIDGVFAHNDEMALGAIEEIEAFGIKPGVDIKVVSVDAVSKEILDTIKTGKINASAQCNPYLGPLLFETIKKIESGKKVEKFIYSKEDIVTPQNVDEHLRKIGY